MFCHLRDRLALGKPQVKNRRPEIDTWLTIVKGSRLDDPEPSAQRARGLRVNLVRCFVHGKSSFSELGASGKPGVVHSPVEHGVSLEMARAFWMNIAPKLRSWLCPVKLSVQGWTLLRSEIPLT